MEDKIFIIGVAGLPRSGKDTVAEKIVALGYFGISLGDIVRDISRDRHKDTPDPISVANMTETSNWMRGLYGPDFALKKALHLFLEAQKEGKIYKGVVVWSVRSPVEADFILAKNGQLIWVEASVEVRYQRAMQHLREGEAQLTPEEFKAQEALQWQPQPGLPANVQMNIEYVKSKATAQFVNNSDKLEDFNEQFSEFINQIDLPN